MDLKELKKADAKMASFFISAKYYVKKYAFPSSACG
jgi:hypothetical protein